ncbi:MAG: site-2 protease family protein [FCB group bacterium]|nr:site-2 protease family protein [FCB group bacterium]
MDVKTAILAAPVIIFSLTVHEYFHAWTANKFGDSTAKDMGRLTLNPLAHLDVFGTLMLFMSNFRFGWAKPVPVNPYNLRNLRHDDLWISAAGPLSNLGMALIAGTIIRILNGLGIFYQYEALSMILFYMVMINVSLAFFNLLPIYPLDGSHIFRNILPERYGPTIDQIERVSPMILMFLILSGFMFGFSVLWLILGPFIKLFVLLFSGITL